MLQEGSRGTRSITEKLWEREFGKGDMSLRLGRVIPDIHKGKGADNGQMGPSRGTKKKQGSVIREAIPSQGNMGQQKKAKNWGRRR